MNILGHDIGVCSWSLRPKGMTDLVAQVKQLGLGHMQLALLDLVQAEASRRADELGILKASGIQLTAGMIHFADEDYTSIAIIRDTGGFMPDATWDQRKRIATAAAALAGELGLKGVTAHVGFIPPSNHEKYAVMLGRVRELAAAFAEHGVELHMETGQEPAHELLKFLNDVGVRNVHVNFDPANMILYGAGDPIEAIHMLGRHIAHVHVKDATLSSKPGVQWGAEVPFGTGQVGAKQFLAKLHSVGYAGPLCIEREAGEDRFGDVQIAIETLKTIVL